MNLSQLKYIIAIANTGSLSVAAQQLGISQPALSKYLAKQQKEIGLELFYRDKKRLQPTEAGRLYLEAARKILTLQKDTAASMRSIDPPVTSCRSASRLTSALKLQRSFIRKCGGSFRESNFLCTRAIQRRSTRWSAKVLPITG